MVEYIVSEISEETKRYCILLEKDPIFLENYSTLRGRECEVYYYLFKGIVHSNNDSLETHYTYWIKFVEVLLKDICDKACIKIKEYFRNDLYDRN